MLLLASLRNEHAHSMVWFKMMVMDLVKAGIRQDGRIGPKVDFTCTT